MAYDQLVLLDDFGMKTYTARAESVVSGGWLLKGSSTNVNVVGSRASTYATSDVLVSHDDEKVSVGLALQDTASGSDVAVLTDGVVILPIGSNPATAGSAVMSSGWGSNVETCPAESGAQMIGRALSTGSHATPSTAYAVTLLRI